MGGYSFWCSRCSASHAGECPPAPDARTPGDDRGPAPGTRWVSELSDDGGGTWARNGFSYEVVRSSASANTVTARYPGNPMEFDLPRGYWDPSGGQNPNGSFSRMVRP